MRKLSTLTSSDARLWQILFLGTLLGVGVVFRDFSIKFQQLLLSFLAGIFTQYFWISIYQLKRVSYLSAFITCLSLALLLRADSLWAHPIAAFVAISSKFLIRVRGKHVFNPGNLGV